VEVEEEGKIGRKGRGKGDIPPSWLKPRSATA